MTAPPVPDTVSDTFSRYPEPARARLLEIRSLIYQLADDIEDIGPLTETLKWGEPAYLTEVSESGTTIRLGVTKQQPNDSAVLFNCKTRLVDMFRTAFPEEFIFEGTRALVIPANKALPREPLLFCLYTALTYHRRKRAE
jgi:hypothetical protein